MDARQRIFENSPSEKRLGLKTIFYFSSASDPSVWVGRSVLLFSSTATRFQDIRNCRHIALTKMQVHRRFEVDFLILFDSLPFIGRELEMVVMLL